MFAKQQRFMSSTAMNSGTSWQPITTHSHQLGPLNHMRVHSPLLQIPQNLLPHLRIWINHPPPHSHSHPLIPLDRLPRCPSITRPNRPHRRVVVPIIEVVRVCRVTGDAARSGIGGVDEEGTDGFGEAIGGADAVVDGAEFGDELLDGFGGGVFEAREFLSMRFSFSEPAALRILSVRLTLTSNSVAFAIFNTKISGAYTNIPAGPR